LGKIAISNDLSISNVLLFKSLSYNLLSIAQLCELGLICKLSPKDVVITSIKSDELIFKGFHYGNLYLVDFSFNDASLTTCLFTKSSKGWLWHRRLAHIGMNQLKKLMKHDLVNGLNNDIIFEKNKLCSACQAGKQIGNTHPTKSVCLLQGHWNDCIWIYLAPQHIEALVKIVIVLLLWMTIQDILEFSLLVTNQMCSRCSRALLRELKMNLISKSRILVVIMVPSSRTLKLKTIVMKRESNMNFQPSILCNKMEWLK
jgi:hypothetical protein